MKYAIILFILLPAFSFNLPAQQLTIPAERGQGEYLGRSAPLSDWAAPTPQRTGKSKRRRIIPKEIPNFTQRQRIPRRAAATAAPHGADPLYAPGSYRTDERVVTPALAFDGIDFSTAGNVLPPDPCGDLNGSHFVQMTNASGGSRLHVYDLEGNLAFELPALNALWMQFGVMGLGDPIVLWDHAANRWMISEFQDFGGNALLVAISVTEDPTGEWYAYRFETPSFPDYPKYSVWHNAYIVTTNEPGDANIPIYALERQPMLAGENPGVQRLGIPKFSEGSFQVATPVDWDGNTPPPAGAPGYVVRLYDDAWEGGDDKVELWEVHLDWEEEDNNFTAGPIDMTGAPFDAEICPNGGFFDCIEQPNDQRVDGLQDIILHRVPYLNFGSHEAILLHFAVDVDGTDRAGLRWMELRKSSGGDWSIYQEGTYSQDDGLSRFAGGISMDFNGNIFMAYSVGGPSRDLSLRYTGRLNGDPLGVMTVEEFEFAEGLSAQSGSRWGDYAAMAVDPLTGTDFWFTGEYMGESGQWKTKILSAWLRRDSNDIGVQELVQPQNSGFLSNAETVQIAVRNTGFKPIANYTVSYQFEGLPFVTDTIADTLASDSIYLHTFVPTVDMEAVGTYDFVLAVAHPLDTAFFNDTLRTQVRQLTRDDVALAEIAGLGQNICDTATTVELIIQNAGVDTLFSATVSTSLNGNAGADIEWAGELPPGETTTLLLELTPLVDGSNQFAATVSAPNGVADQNPGNNSREASFSALLGGETVILRLLTDSYPEETTWEIRDESDEVIAQGGPYVEGTTLQEEPFCLPDACYTLRLLDSWGDGLIGPPPGDVEVIDAEGNVLAQLGTNTDFGQMIDLPFCSSFSCQVIMDANAANESAPGAEDGQIILSLINGLETYEYSIDGGATFQTSPVFNNLPGGTYNCVGRDLNSCEADTTITLYTCTLELSAEVMNASGGQANGSITVNVNGGLGGLSYQLDNGGFQAVNVFEGLPPGNYLITARDSAGCEQSLLVEIDMTSSTSSRFFGKSVKLFPNPTEGFVRVEIRGLESRPSVPVRVLSAQGQTVRYTRLATYGDSTRGVVSLYGLPPGTYFLRFGHEALPRLYRVVKQQH